jgi:4-amino-4-deoxy-L-arabinose transferase-like glycosyltransferase
MDSLIASIRLDVLSRRRFAWIAIALIVTQAVLWIGAPLLLEGSIRQDVAEGVIDGREWQLSYLVHPPFSSWLNGLASTLGPFRYAAVDTIGFVLASGAFAIVAALLAKVDRPASGLVALLAGLASPFATYVPIQVNHNIGLMPFWAAALAAAWFAFEGGSLAQWAAFGVVVGLGLWAKYSILHLVAPLAVLFFLVPEWRRRTLTLGPWLALLLCAAIVAPHFLDVLRKGSTTLQYATRTLPAPFSVRLGWIGEFALDCALAQAPMALVALAACGRAPLVAAIRAMTSLKSASRLDLFVHVAALGPALVILGAAPLGVHPHYLWITAPSLGFALWWGRAAGRAGFARAPGRVFVAFAALAALLIVGYVGMREIAPRVALRPPYADMDGPALAALAQRYWADRETGPIPYIVSLDLQRGLQAGGSIVFDLPYRVRVLQDDDPANAPWIDLADMRRRGALVVSPRRLAEGTRVEGAEVRQIEKFERPMRRGASSEPIFFGILPPNS